MVDPKRDYPPSLPMMGSAAGSGDSVAVDFVVDERGVPIEATMRVLSARHPDYARLAVDAALHSRYVPATAGGCPVNGLLQRAWQMTVKYRVNQSPG